MGLPRSKHSIRQMMGRAEILLLREPYLPGRPRKIRMQGHAREILINVRHLYISELDLIDLKEVVSTS